MTPEEQAHFRVLQAIERNPDITQRELAEQLGLSLGKTNFLINALLEKGAIKMENFRRSDTKLKKIAYPTPDGTGVRDYIHVVDLAAGHVAALNHLERQGGLLTVNLGTGRGYSVLDMVRAFSAASGREIPYRIAARRVGDIAQCWADPTLANRLLGWQATRGLDAMCADAWNWQRYAQAQLS